MVAVVLIDYAVPMNTMYMSEISGRKKKLENNDYFVNTINLNMAKEYKRKTNRTAPPTDVLLRAVQEVKNNDVSIRQAAKQFDVNYRTLARFCEKVSQDELASGKTDRIFGLKNAGKFFLPPKN
ncbi:CENP-B N-terminal DNA-binding domain [Popillia japonica]|uniref:CENP-B N-terminal DNA-binding domain n=1 Tax=Popillia japonica TaxID=7064 RepID=A0AAW1IV33_POPJA